ncbi:MAG: thiol-activated cytolysin family protein [Pseudomonadota bacterium]
MRGVAGLFVMGVVACGSEPATEAWNSNILGSTLWSDLSPVTEVSEVIAPQDPQAAFEETLGGEVYQCTAETRSLTKSPDQFVAINPDQSIIWLGNLVQGQSHYQVGDLQELSIRKRAPLKVSINLLREDNTRTIEAPSLTSVQAAIGDLVEQAQAAEHRAGSSASFTSTSASSLNEASIKLGISAEYLGGDAEAKLSVETSTNQRTHYAYFIQRAFTVSMELPAQPSDVLTPGFRESDLEPLLAVGSVSDDNPPLYISSVTYGRILIYSLTASAEDSRISAAINASYRGATGGGSAEMDAADRTLLEQASISVATHGGEEDQVLSLIRSGNLSEYFTEDTALTSMRPISFELRRLSDNEIAGVARTTEYVEKTCKLARGPKIGERVRVTLDDIIFNDICDAGVDGVDNKGEFYGTVNLDYVDRSETRQQHKLFEIRRDSKRNFGRRDRVSGQLEGPWTVTADRINGEDFRLSGVIKEFDQPALAKKTDDSLDERAGRININLSEWGDLSAKSFDLSETECDMAPSVEVSLKVLDDIYAD